MIASDDMRPEMVTPAPALRRAPPSFLLPPAPCVLTAAYTYTSRPPPPLPLTLAGRKSPYGHDYMATPNFQRLADEGFFFRRTYVQMALCAPSRTVLLTGRRPDTSRVWAIGPYFRETTGRNWTSLPQAFKQAGYRAIGHGKIFHEGNASGFPLDQDAEFGAWSVPFFHPKVVYNTFNQTHPSPQPGVVKTPLSNVGIDAPWQTFNDGQSAVRAAEWIANASAYTAPFFLAVGFHRPHIPYVYPQAFEYKGDVRFPPRDYAITTGVPEVAPHDWTGEGSHYGDLAALRPNITAHDFQKNLTSLCSAVPLAVQAGMKRSYLSCIQYIDHLVGFLLDALRAADLYDDTHVIFWGDHGYGERPRPLISRLLICLGRKLPRTCT